jgi:hypothetical protein
VDCGGQCNVPWLIRAVNAEDTNGQLTGGFVSAEFWIGTSDSRSTSTRRLTFAITRTSTVSSISSTAAGLSTYSSSSSPTSQPAGSTTPSSSTSSYATTPPASQGNSSTSPSTSLSTNTAIGIGVGLGVGLAAMAFGWFLLWRHYRRRRSSDSTPDEHRYADKSSKTILAEVMTKEVGPTELAISSSKYYEAPGRNQEPQELYAGTPTQYHSRSVWTG